MFMGVILQTEICLSIHVMTSGHAAQRTSHIHSNADIRAHVTPTDHSECYPNSQQGSSDAQHDVNWTSPSNIRRLAKN